MKETTSPRFRGWFTPLALPLLLAAPSLVSGCAAEYAEDAPPTAATAPPAEVQTPSGPAGDGSEDEEAAPPPTPEPGAPPPPPVPGASTAPPSAPPSGPATAPPAGPTTPPPPVATDARPVYTPTSAAPSGQWVYTEGYGWVWMPYEQAYTYVSPAQDDAYAYVYYPAGGWEWIHAPWVIGVGPRPYWGRVGPVRFAWYTHPWFRPRHAYYYRHPYSRGRRYRR